MQKSSSDSSLKQLLYKPSHVFIIFSQPNQPDKTQVPIRIEVPMITTDMVDKVAKMVKEKPLVIVSKSTCCMSHTIKTLFGDFGANTTIYELDEIPKGKEVKQHLTRRGYNPTVPVVFIGGELVGGANKVMSLHINRSLVPMLKRAGALWPWKDDHL